MMKEEKLKIKGNTYIPSKDKLMDLEYIKKLTNGEIKSNCIPSALILGEPGAGKTGN